MTAATGNWLAVDLQQPGSNRRAVGAWIEVDCDGTTLWREVTVGGGHGGGQALPHHFGIGAAEAARVRVHWPDGAVSDWRPAVANEVLAIRRGE